eukprot:TRINITY_DN50458_c0_g1_i1.p1 TRINITY_DN50458_c0_g1~~TRINITY_DN50458_c0_g1_i1.p1  ORF type:complete len:693 (+),score=115.46 TRINITY_DN50458_c0_g1_i1:51-2129(+)
MLLRATVVACCVLGALGATCGGLPCPADMPDSDEFHSGSILPALKVPVDDGDLVITPASTNEGFPHAPYVFVGLRSDDPFTTYMVTDTQSIARFLDAAHEVNVTYVFAAHSDQTIVSGLKTRLNDQIAKLPTSLQKYWRSSIKFATKTLEELAALDPDSRDPNQPSTNVLPRVLKSKSFQSLAKWLRVQLSNGQWLNTTRIDGFFQFVGSQDLHNHSPVNPITGNISVFDESLVCSSQKPNTTTEVVLLMESKLLCSPEEAMKWFVGAPIVQAVVFMASPGQSLKCVGINIEDNDESAFSLLGAMVPSDLKLYDAVQRAPRVTIVDYTFSTGQYAAVTSGVEGSHLKQIGSPINPLLAVVRWTGEYLDYTHRLHVNLTNTPSVEVPVYISAIGSRDTTGSDGALSYFEVPQLVSGMNEADILVKFECTGNGDFECPVWDRIATVKVTCSSTASETFELTRWITPYRRSDGIWVASVDHLLGVILKPGDHCQAALTGFSFGDYSEPWVTTATLRFRHNTEKRQATMVTKLFEGGTYNVNYNENRTKTFSIPETVSSVRLSAIITGHGSDAYDCCEFIPTRHTFTLSTGHTSQTFTWAFMDAADKWGCTLKTVDGVEPNGYGAWWFGRNGWCNGQIVEPLRGEITFPAGTADLQVTYKSEIYNSQTQQWEKPACTGSCGNIDMTSVLTGYSKST